MRRLLDEVRSRRAKLALLDLRGATSANPNEGLRSVTEAAAIEEKPPQDAGAAAVAAGEAAPDVLDGPSPDPEREAAIAYRDRDVNTVLALLGDMPVLRMEPETQWIFASCLMSKRRFADAKPILATLERDTEHTHLAQAAKLQLATHRIPRDRIGGPRAQPGGEVMTPALATIAPAPLPGSDAVELKDAFCAFAEVADRLRSRVRRALGQRVAPRRRAGAGERTPEGPGRRTREPVGISGRGAARAIPCGVVVAGNDGVVVMANPAAERILGCKGKDLIGADAGALVDADGRALLRLHEGPGRVGERMVAAQDGARVIDGAVVQVTDTDGRELGLVEVLNDRTEVRALKEEVRRLDKLAELGRVAAIIAHEIRNPLSGIKGFASLLMREFETDKEHAGALRHVRRILEGAERADGIIDSVLFLARPRALSLAVVDAETLLLDALEDVATAKPQAMRAVVVARRVEPAGLEVVCDRVRVLQALVNLIQNAAEAMAGKGQLEVSVCNAGDAVNFTVSDSGPGVPRDLRERLFEPFFTTKNEGAGLGLALVARIAELHGGRVTIGEAEGGGAKFVLSVPSSHDPKEAFAS